MLRWSFDVCQDPGCSLAQLPSKSWSAPMIDSGSRCLSIKWWIFQTFEFGLLFGALKLGIIWYIAEMEEMDQTNQNIYRSLWRYFHEWSSSDGNSSSSQGTYSNIHLQLADIPFFVVTFIWRLSYHLRPSHWKHRRKNLTNFWGHVGWHEAPYQWSIWEPFQITWWTVLRKTSVIT